MIALPSGPKSGRSKAALVRVALLAALAVLAGWSMSAECQEQCTLSIEAEISPAMHISVTPDLLNWDAMRPGPNVLDDAVSVTMLSNVNCTATIGCDSPYLTDPSGSGAALKEPMEWKTGQDEFRALSVMPAVVRLGGPDSGTRGPVRISFRQIVDYDDLPLKNPAARYIMTVRFHIEPRL